MDPRERYHDPEELLRMAGDALKLGMWTALPCIVVSFDPATCTCVLKAAIKGQTVDGQGNQTLVDLPLLLDVPVHCYRGGSWAVTMPIAAGDEAVAVFSSRNPDGWWQNGGVQREPVFRGNTLSDAFAFIGPFSQKTKISGWATDSVRIRNLANDTFIELADGKIVTITAPNGINLNGVMIDSSGNVSGINDLTTNGNTSMGGGAKKVVLDGDPVSGGVVHATSTKVVAT